MQYYHRARLTPDPDGGFNVIFPDVPEALTFGDTRDEALESAREALGMALLAILDAGRPLPQPADHADTVSVSPSAADAAKIAVIEAFAAAGISKSELARRLGVAVNEAHRILDPRHATKIDKLDRAAAALGRRLVVSSEPA